MELRLYAEDPAQGFVPSAGTLHHLRWPAEGVRLETGVEAGAVVTPHYDPMLAKLIVHGDDRGAALAAARRALAATQVVGVAHNLALLEALLAAPEVTGGVPDTGTIDRLLSHPPAAPAPWRTAAAAIAAAWALRQSRRDDPALPASSWPALTHWRLGAPDGYRPLRPQYVLRGDHGEVQAIVATEAGSLQRFDVQLGDRAHAVTFGARAGDARLRVGVDGVEVALSIGRDGDRIWLGDGRHTETLQLGPALQVERAPTAGAGAALAAPMTGKVLEVRVRDGDAVAAGQVLVVVESMKMEMRLAAPHAGVARSVRARVGAGVERGAVLVVVDAPEVSE